MPWPIIEEAAKIGLYSMDFIANAFGDPTGITFPMVSEELAWGDAGITLALLGTTLGVSGHPRQRHARADRRVGAAVLRHRRRHSRRRVRGERGRRRLRRVVAAHARGLRRGQGRVGDQRHQDVDHQRRHHARAVHARGRRRGRARAEEPRSRVVRRPAGHARPDDGPEVQEDGHPRQSHGRGRVRRRARARSLPARRQGEARRPARPCA